MRTLFFTILIFVVACHQKPASKVIARIGTRDSVTVDEFSLVLKSEKTTDVRQALELTINEKLQCIDAIDQGLDQEPDVALDLLREKRKYIRGGMLQKFVYDKLITDREIRSYRRNIGKRMGVQFIMTYFDELPASKIRARRLIDSLARKANPNTFAFIAEWSSEYTDPKTGRGSTVPEGVEYGSNPLSFDNAVFDLPKDGISPVLEIQDKFMIVRILHHLPAKPISVALSDDAIVDELKKQIKANDTKTFDATVADVEKTMMAKARPVLQRRYLDSLVRIGKDTLDFKALTEVQKQWPLLRFDSASYFTLADWFERQTLDHPWTSEVLEINIPAIFKSFYEEYTLISTGFTETPEFTSNLERLRKKIIIKKIISAKLANQKPANDSVLQELYKRNSFQFRFIGRAQIQSIIGPLLKPLEIARNRVLGGDSIHQIVKLMSPDGFNGLNYEQSEINFDDFDEAARLASRMKIGDISTIVHRPDGRYQFFRLFDKLEPAQYPYELAAESVRDYYTRLEKLKMESQWMYSLRQKYPVTIFETALNAMRP